MAQDYSLGEAILGTAVSLDGLSDGLARGEEAARAGATRITDALSGTLKVGLALIGVGVAALGGAIAAGLGEAMDAQAGMAQLDAVLRSTGGAAGVTRDEVLALASSLSAANGLSKFSDDAVLAAENLLLTFTNIGRDVFPAATQAAIDMAAALGTDPQAQAIALGKALNDPVAGITALTRVGVTFTEEQKAVIESLVETGDVASAQQIILAELGKEFGGSAAAAAGTLAGQLVTLQEQFNGVLEGVGTALVPAIQEFVGVLNSPAVMGTIQDLADMLAGALGTAIQWIAGTAIPAFVGAWEMVGPAIQTAGAVISSIAGDAFAWGENIVGSLAAGISAAVSYVVDALSSVGSVIQYWLEPGSPPKLLPDLDVWGKGAASAWADGFADADLSGFDTLAGTIEQTLRGMAEAGAISEDGLIPAIIGSRAAVGDALAELARTGTISEASFAAIRESAGAAGADVEELTRRYLALRQAGEAVTDAQAELDDALSADEALKNQVMVPKAAKEASAARIKAAKEELALRKGAEARAKHAFGQQQGLIDQQQKTNDLLLEERKRQEQAAKAETAGAAKKSAADKEAERAAKEAERQAKAAKKAQDDYNLSTADTAGKLEILRARLSTLNPAQAEYWTTLQQIRGLEGQQAKEQERITKEQEAEQKKLADAQWQHEYAVASNEQKLKMLQDRLATLNPSQAEYYQTLTQIAQIEDQIAKEREKNAKKAGAGGGASPGDVAAMVGGLPKLPKMPGAEGPAKGGLGEDIKAQLDPAFAAVEDARARIQATFDGILAFVAPVWQAIADAVTTRMEQARAFIAKAMPGIQLVITDVLSAVQTFWENNGASIMAFVQTTWDTIEHIIDTVLAFLRVVVLESLDNIHTYFVENGDTIQTVLSGVWLAIQGIVTTVLAAIEIVIRTTLALISGDWNTQLGAIKAAGETMFGGIRDFITGVLDALVGLFGTNLAELDRIWNSNFTAMAQAVETIIAPAVAAIQEKIGELVTYWKETLAPAIADVRKGFADTLAGGIALVRQPLENMAGWFNDIYNAVDDLIGRVEDFVDSLADVVIPDWLQGHSPPPLADWFSWSAEAAGELNAELPQLNSGLGGPMLPSLGGGPQAQSARAIISFDDRGADVLRELVRVEIREQNGRTASAADARGRI